LRAEKDLEVGQYYMRKGDVDAAIDRFQDATTAKPGYAIPFRYLGEAQEKKGLKKQAIASYSRYLELYPHAEDGDKIRKKIDKLRSEVERKKKY
jgi:outer membrane protein assembly factor BamD (BamD/ComL family)